MSLCQSIEERKKNVDYHFYEPTKGELEEIKKRMYMAIPESSAGRYNLSGLRPIEVVYDDFLSFGDRIVAVRKEKEIVGYIHFGPQKESEKVENRGHIFDIFIDRLHRRRGLGSLLLGEALSRMNEHGMKTVTANTYRGGAGWWLLKRTGFIEKTVCMQIECRSSRPLLSPTGLSIIRGTPKDLLMFSQGVQDTLEYLNRTELSNRNYSMIFYRLNLVLESGATLLICVDGEKPVGFAIYTIFDDLMTYELLGYLDFIFVDPEHRRRGIGRELLGDSLERLNRNGVNEMFFECSLDDYDYRWSLRAGMKEFSIQLEKKSG